MAKKRYYESYAGGIDKRRALEARDSSMIPGDRGIALMPQSVVYREYPSQYYNMPEGLNDKMSGVDRQIRDDMKGKKPINSSKY